MSDFPFKVGDKVVHDGELTPGFHITVASADFPGPYNSYREFAGIDSTDECLKVYSTTGLQPFVEPPKRRTWTFETIDEVPNLDIQYIDGERFVTNHFGVHVPVPVLVPGTLREVAS